MRLDVLSFDIIRFVVQQHLNHQVVDPNLCSPCSKRTSKIVATEVTPIAFQSGPVIDYMYLEVVQ